MTEEKLKGQEAIDHLKKLGVIDSSLTVGDVANNFEIIQKFAEAAADLCAKNEDATMSLLGLMDCFEGTNSVIPLAMSNLKLKFNDDEASKESFQLAQQLLLETYIENRQKGSLRWRNNYNSNWKLDMKEPEGYIGFFTENAQACCELAKISKEIMDINQYILYALERIVSPDLPAELGRVDRDSVRQMLNPR